jgi:hypothetical protein
MTLSNRQVQAARKALDTWGPSPLLPVAAALREAHIAGIGLAAQLLQGKSELALAMKIRRLQQEIGSRRLAGAKVAADSGARISRGLSARRHGHTFDPIVGSSSPTGRE